MIGFNFAISFSFDLIKHFTEITYNTTNCDVVSVIGDYSEMHY